MSVDRDDGMIGDEKSVEERVSDSRRVVLEPIYPSNCGKEDIERAFFFDEKVLDRYDEGAFQADSTNVVDDQTIIHSQPLKLTT